MSQGSGMHTFKINFFLEHKKIFAECLSCHHH